MFKVRVRVKRNNSKAVAKTLHRAASDAVRDVLEDAITEANDRAPWDEGDLIRSSDVVHFPDKAAGAVTYDTDYAIKQHEDPTLHHPRRGEHHWLEKTLEENAPRYFEYIAEKMRAAKL